MSFLLTDAAIPYNTRPTEGEKQTLKMLQKLGISGPSKLFVALTRYHPNTAVTHTQLKWQSRAAKLENGGDINEAFAILSNLEQVKPLQFGNHGMIIPFEFMYTPICMFNECINVDKCWSVSSSDWEFVWQLDSVGNLHRFCFFHRKGL